LEGWRIDSSNLNAPIQCSQVGGTYCPGGTAVGTAAAATNTDDADTHQPCVNSINGVSTSATDVNGNIVVGCNNTLASNNATLIVVYGDNNIISGNEVRESTDNGERLLEVGSSSEPVENSTITGNVAGALVCLPCKRVLRRSRADPAVMPYQISSQS
jgi:hypothetical protein